MVGQLGHPGPVTPRRLSVADAGEVLTLQRAAYVTEARAHGDLDLPPLLETLDETRAALSGLSWGIRETGRLVASVRLTVSGHVGVIGRLVVAPDRQGAGLGGGLLRFAESAAPAEVTLFRLFTGSKSTGPLHLYAKHGYRETHRTPEHDHELVHLEKTRVHAPG
ncbi:GNAT family N-acetyltransferase [Amycolatopsis vancoresmycina]|uniref:GCN5-related N-acetyltransferase n=1 Tax=Amycolatopsis vancoresmycina DSM 44592 TaxID=1292037 RepID=R1H4E2_9PSEU|nr:GNAT family N-acetyltransferase [Amycolatopsis vancoresmycina]EOD58505.1 GCN5-related N-acetyltransferase [Amycolatopsis vancoresmycina DSM 44592]